VSWKKIDDDNVVHIWKRADGCECDVNHTSVKPNWYQDNGTPQCYCGLDMIYSHTEIRA